VSEKHTMPSQVCKLEQEVQALKHQIQTLSWDLEASRAICSRKNERIRHLIRLGLETSQYAQPKHRELWEQEEEL